MMCQPLVYIASVFSSSSQPIKEKANNHVTFTDTNEKASKVAALAKSNKKTIRFYLAIGALAFVSHLFLVTVPKFHLDSFDPLQPDGWKLITLSLVPLFVYLASINAMRKINKPILEGTKLTEKNSGLDLNNNEFVFSLKVIIALMSVCQVLSILSDHLLWPVVLIVPFWCYQLATKVAQSEYERFAPSPKKQQWVKLNLTRSPKATSPIKQAESQTTKEDNAQVRATPRTRTKRAVKNIITGVTDKYHAFEETVAHQLSQKIFTPLSPKIKMIE